MFARLENSDDHLNSFPGAKKFSSSGDLAPPLRAIAAREMASKSKNTTITSALCLLTIIAFVCGLQVCAASSSHPPTADERLGHACKRISSIKRLSEMQELIDNLRQVLESKKRQENLKERPLRDQANPLATVALTSTLVVSLTNSYSRPLRFSNPNPFASCLAQSEAILDLDELIGERTNVCSSEHLDRIESYYARHLETYYTYGERRAKTTRPSFARSKSMRAGGSGGSKTFGGSYANSKPITMKFFQLYANQVSFVCKSNLLHSLHKVGDSGHVSTSDFEKVMPWLREENTKTCQRVEGLMQDQLPDGRERLAKATSEENGANLASAAKSVGVTRDDFRHCNARKLLMELSNVDELVEVIESSESFVKYEGNSEGKVSSSGESSGLFLIVPENQKQVVGDMLTTCAKLRPIYEQTVLPIVRLARLGFNPTHTKFDEVCSGDQLIKKWFGITLVCNSMLSSQLPRDLEKYKELIKDNNMSRKSFVVVDDDDGKNEMSSSMTTHPNGDEARKLDLIDEEVLRTLITNPIEDELWIYKYGTTRLQRIKDSIIKRVFKLFKVEDINSHIVFRKRVADTSRWIVRIVLITLALVTFDRTLS